MLSLVSLSKSQGSMSSISLYSDYGLTDGITLIENQMADTLLLMENGMGDMENRLADRE